MAFPTPQLDALGVGTSAPGTGSITVTGTITPSQTSGIVGTTTNNNANAGSVGEYVSAALASGSAISLTTNTPANVVSVSLTAGDWDCQGQITHTASTGSSFVVTNVTTTTAGITNGNNGGYAAYQTNAATITNYTLNTGRLRLSLASTTTVFLVANSSFPTGTGTAYGFMSCRRVR